MGYNIAPIIIISKYTLMPLDMKKKKKAAFKLSFNSFYLSQTSFKLI